MKRIFLPILALLISVAGYSQPKTVISGKVINKPDKPVILLVYSFDTTKMVEVESMLQVKINDDNTFSFVTDEISRPLTRCRIGFMNEGQPILLSPGDSVRTEFQYGAMDTTMEFYGTVATRNYFMKEYQLTFSEKRINSFYRNLIRDTQQFKTLTDWRNEKLEFLKGFNHPGPVDSAFFRHESVRINCEYFNDLIGLAINRAERDSACDSLVATVLTQNRISDDDALFNSREYRKFVIDYIDFRTSSLNGRKATLQDYLDRTQMEFSGLTKTYCSFHYLKNAVDEIHDGKGKLLLRNYFMKISDDPILVRLLGTMDINLTGRNYRDASRVLLSSWSLILTILIYAIVGFAIFKVITYRSKSGKRIDPLYIIKGLIFLSALAYLSNYFLIYRLSPDKSLAAGRVFTWIAFVGLQLYYLIPVWFKKGKYQWYAFQMGLLTLIYFGALITIGNADNHLHAPFQWLHHRSIISMVNSWLILVALSFLVYYVDLLIRRKQSISYLFRERLVSLEVVVNVLIVFLVISRTFAIYVQNSSRQDDLFVFIIGILIFYCHAVILIPHYMLKQRVGKYWLATLLVCVGTILAFYLENVFGIYRSLVHIGVRIPFFEVIQLPEQFVIKTALWIQLLIVPAWIYAFVKQQLLQKNVGFKMFRNKEAELQQLRSQVNPHFLFNSLNTLYAFALKENSGKTAEYIAKLANLMRYLVDDMEKEKIPVQKEISYISDYINLQAIRSSVEHNIEIKNDIDEDQNIMIAPMLMIPFVENAFKHGINPNSVSELKVTFQIVDNRFQFVIENSVDKNFEAFYKEKGFGIGIANVRQRLEHIYPERHTLSIADTGDRFIVIMAVSPD